MPEAIVMEKVRKTFGEKIAVEGNDLVIPQGGLYGFIGPNGAGKTTSIRMIMDIIAPDRGEVRFFGRRRERSDMARVGYLPEERGLYRKMTVRRVLAYYAGLKGMAGRAAPSRHA